jgi:hypothetical protein
MSDPETSSAKPLYADITDAEIGVPFIYFDGASCHGTVGGAISGRVNCADSDTHGGRQRVL